MIRTVDEGLLALQSGVFAQEHYGAEHPAVTKALGRACRLLGEAMGTDGKLSVMCAADHVVVMGKALASSASLCDGLFQRLGERGVTGLTFTPGLTAEELADLAAWLWGPDTTWEGSAHVRLGSVTAAGGGDGDPCAKGGTSTLDPECQSNAVRDVWTAVSAGDWSDKHGVESVVSAICTAVTGSSGMIIPLAYLKRHDEYTFVHTTNVAILSASLGEAVGMSDTQIFDLTTAALLHDVGKRAVPRAVLNKRATLSAREMRVMRQHPVQGARILFGSKEVPDVVPVVAFEHHIHLDGSGYPNVHPGWKISLASQVVQVADVYDALRTNRPYRKALSQEAAFDLMLRDASVRFDGTLLDLFFERVARRTERETMPELWTPLHRAA